MHTIEPVVPAPDRYSAFFWEATREHRLDILRCDDCGFYVHWPRPVCKRCLSESLSPSTVSGRGHVYTFTVCEQAFHPWFDARLPYVLAVIELEEQPGLKLVSNVVDIEPTAIQCGMAVEVTFADIGDAVLPLFRPAEGGEQ